MTGERAGALGRQRRVGGVGGKLNLEMYCSDRRLKRASQCLFSYGGKAKLRRLEEYFCKYLTFCIDFSVCLGGCGASMPMVTRAALPFPRYSQSRGVLVSPERDQDRDFGDSASDIESVVSAFSTQSERPRGSWRSR